MPDRVVEGFLRATRANRIYVDAAAARRRMAHRALRPRGYGPPRLGRRVRVEAVRHAGWPVYVVRPSGGQARGSVVYLHGGGWVAEIVRQHWTLVAQVAWRAGTTVVVPIYPLVPFGTAAEVVPAIADLAAELRGRHGPVRLAGDSAGGQIALSAALDLRDRHGARAEAILLISPALDLSWSNPLIPLVQPSDPWLGVPGGRVFSEAWRGDLDVSDPRVSPLCGDLAGLVDPEGTGEIVVFTGTRDILNPDAGLLAERATAAGVRLDLREESGQLHDYPLLPTRTGARARDAIVRLLTVR